jgi:hypothetical protein
VSALDGLEEVQHVGRDQGRVQAPVRIELEVGVEGRLGVGLVAQRVLREAQDAPGLGAVLAVDGARIAGDLVGQGGGQTVLAGAEGGTGLDEHVGRIGRWGR